MSRAHVLRPGWCLGAVVALVGGFGLVGVTSATGQTASETFEAVGDAQAYTVPAGVCGVTIDAFGAAGGNGAGSGPDSVAAGGSGGHASASIPVTPGEILSVYVGGEGGGGLNNGGAAGGFNGGGDGGAAPNGGGGGGGASDVRQGGTDVAHRVVVAGGGGGGGAAPNFLPTIGVGGSGGGANGDAGVDGGASVFGGGGGTQVGAGAAGTGTAGNGTDGALGSGGQGADAGPTTGGGGGGGYFGGGGGGADQNNFGGGGGGGGSGFGPAGVAFETGVHAGAGVVTIAPDPAVPCSSSPLVPLVPGVAPAPLLVTPTFTG